MTIISDFNFAINFEVIDSKRAKAYVNNKFIAYVRVQQYKDQWRITTRNNNEASKRLVPLRAMYVDESTTIEEALQNRNVITNVLALALKTYLRRTTYLKTANPFSDRLVEIAA